MISSIIQTNTQKPVSVGLSQSNFDKIVIVFDIILTKSLIFDCDRVLQYFSLLMARHPMSTNDLESASNVLLLYRSAKRKEQGKGRDLTQMFEIYESIFCSVWCARRASSQYCHLVPCSRKNDYRTDLRWRLEYNEKHTSHTQYIIWRCF